MGIFSMANLQTGVSEQTAAEKFPYFLILFLLDLLHISWSLGGLTLLGMAMFCAAVAD